MSATPRKAVKSITLTSPSHGAIIGGTIGQGTSLEADEIVAFGDVTYTAVPRQAAKYDDLTIQLLDEGQTPPTVSPTPVTLAGTVVFSDGTNTTTLTLPGEAYIVTAVSYGSVDVDGDRKGTIDITLKKVGGDASISTGTVA